MSCSPAAPALSPPSSTSSPASVSSATSSPFMPALAFSPGSPFIDSQAAAGAPSPSSLTQTDGELSTCTTGMPHLFDLSPHGHPDEQQWSSSSSLQNDAGEQNTSYSHLRNEKPVEAENLDCNGRASSSSNIPSPILEQDDIAMCLDESADMGFSPSKEADVKEIVRPDQMYFSGMDVAPCCKEESSSDDVFMLRLEELLEAGIPQELVGGSGSSCVDDLFASGVPNTAQDVPVADGLSEWSLDSLKEFERLPFQEEEVAQAGPTDGGGEEESASQLFTSWLRNNAHWISLSDLRKIKLRTSTIENVTSRLGGGKKGLMLFLKFVLMWVQNSQMKRTDGTSAMAPSSVAGMPEFVGISALGMDSHQSSTREQGVEALVGHSQCRTFPHMSAFPYSEDWITSRSRWMQALNGDQGFTALPNPNFHSLDTAWLQHSRLSRNVSTMPPSNSQSSRAGLNGQSVPGDIANMVMMMQQQHRHDANPAATTRAARKSRMERQRWSVRRNRKWAAGRHPNQHRYMSGSTDSSIHHNPNVQSWSQFVATTPGCSNSEVCASQERLVCRSSVLDVEQVAYPYPFDLPKKMEKSLRLLFHKELKQSDVGNLGRIVLPKKAAETCLPPLELRDGVNLDIEDLNSSKVWNMRYRFWPNNKSRMYLLENTSDFVKSYDLKEGDFMMLYYNNATNRYMIRGAKGSGQGAGAAANNGDLEGMGDEASIGDKETIFSRGGMDMVGIARSESVSDDTLLAELTEQSLEDLKDIPDFTI